MLLESNGSNDTGIFLLTCVVCFLGMAYKMQKKQVKKDSCCGGKKMNGGATQRPKTVLVCLSPGNSFFNVDNLRGMAAYAKKSYEHVFLFTGESISWHNYKALGRKESRWKRDMKDHHIRVMKGLDLAQLEKYTLIEWDDVTQRKTFVQAFEQMETLHKHSEKFATDVDSLVEEAMQSYMKHTGRTTCDIAEARLFLLKELAFFLAFAKEYNNDGRWEILYCCPFKIVGRLCRGEYGSLSDDKIGVVNFKETGGC